MPISSTRLVPELQYYVENLVTNSTLNKNEVLSPVSIDQLYLYDNKTFIRLLFDDTWPPYWFEYRYLYRLESVSAYPYVVKMRLMIYPQSGQYFVSDSDDTSVCSINIFNLHNDDFRMLDKLLEYRIDSTGTVLIGIDYDSLNTRLAKLIYIYLDLKINEDFSKYDNTTLIADPTNVLENCYELYVSEQIFKYISSLGGVS